MVQSLASPNVFRLAVALKRYSDRFKVFSSLISFVLECHGKKGNNISTPLTLFLAFVRGTLSLCISNLISIDSNLNSWHSFHFFFPFWFRKGDFTYFPFFQKPKCWLFVLFYQCAKGGRGGGVILTVRSGLREKEHRTQKGK